jgi:large subunit ribosomal protein L25
MKSVSLLAYPRTLRKRGGVKKLRGNGRIPAVIYGRHNPPQTLEIGVKDMERLMHHAASENLLVDLSIEDDSKSKKLALVQDVQHHALTGKVLHVDLHEIVESEQVTITIPLETTGEAIGVKTGGGVLEHVLFKVKVRGLPKDIPEVLQIDVTNMEGGSSLHIGELQPPEGVEILGDKKIVVISVAEPRVEVEEAAAEAVAATQPEMIKEKKEKA